MTSYTQSQQNRQVTVIKPAAPSPASSTFSIYPVTSTVQPVAAAASVVPSYSQSPTYSTNAVTYSGELRHRCLFSAPSQFQFLCEISGSLMFVSSSHVDLLTPRNLPERAGSKRVWLCPLRNLVFGLRGGCLLRCLQLLPAAAAAAEAGGGRRGSDRRLDGQHVHQETPVSEQTASTQAAAQTSSDPLLRRV